MGPGSICSRPPVFAGEDFQNITNVTLILGGLLSSLCFFNHLWNHKKESKLLLSIIATPSFWKRSFLNCLWIAMFWFFCCWVLLCRWGRSWNPYRCLFAEIDLEFQLSVHQVLALFELDCRRRFFRVLCILTFFYVFSLLVVMSLVLF